VIVRRAEAGEQDSQEEHIDRGVATKLPQAHRSDHSKGTIRNDVPEIRYAEEGPLIGERVIALILDNGPQ